MHPGTLYIVPTPIGNLEDITLRALRILKEVDLIAAEDTRHSRRLLSHFGITTALTSCYREKEREKSAQLIQQLSKGKSIALISDAGTPALSDPGAIVVRAARDAQIPVVPLPGASALTTAFSASGIIADGCTFLGFPPPKSGARRSFLASIVHHRVPVILYESPRRIGALLHDALAILGDRDACYARELTKKHEEIVTATLSTLAARVDRESRGEFVVIICPAAGGRAEGESLDEILRWHRDHSDISIRDVSRKLSDDLGASRSAVYQLALKIWNEN